MTDPRQCFKKQLTEQMILWYNASHENQIGYAEAFKVFWLNTRTHGGLRLTDQGHALFSDNDVGKYEFDIPTVGMTNNEMLLLDKKLNTPYYIMRLKIPKSRGALSLPCVLVLYGHEEATMLTLHGDLKRFLELL
jgi:hypothetical protein